MAAAIIHAEFWTGRTGRAMRALPHAVRDVAVYLLTCHEKNLYGLFTIDPQVIAHALTRDVEEVTRALEHLVALDFCQYDVASGWIWIVEMARLQFGAPLKPADYRCGAAKKWYRGLLRNPFLGAWWDRYADDFHLDSDPSPVERRDSFYGTASPPGTAPVASGAQPRTEVQEKDLDLFGTSTTDVQVSDLGNAHMSAGEVAAAFERVWARHPNGKQKKDALEVWKKLKLTPQLLAAIDASHEAHCADFEWQKEGGRFCPRLVNWLKKHGWQDRIDPSRPIVNERTSRTIAAVQNASRLIDADEEAIDG